MNKKFDFKQPYKAGEDFEEYVKEAEFNLKNRMKKNNGNIFLIGFVSLLLVSFIALGGYTWFQVAQNNSNSGQNNQAVLGEKESAIQNIYSGEGFSILAQTASPKGFELTKTTGETAYFPGKQVVQTLLKSDQTSKGQRFVDGVTVTRLENDGKYNAVEFSQYIAKNLGSNYTIGKNDIEIPKDVVLTQIDAINNSNKTLFTTITTDNYFVIEIQNDSKNSPDRKEYNEFIGTILPNLYLN